MPVPELKVYPGDRVRVVAGPNLGRTGRTMGSATTFKPSTRTVHTVDIDEIPGLLGGNFHVGRQHVAEEDLVVIERDGIARPDPLADWGTPEGMARRVMDAWTPERWAAEIARSEHLKDRARVLDLWEEIGARMSSSNRLYDAVNAAIARAKRKED